MALARRRSTNWKRDFAFGVFDQGTYSLVALGITVAAAHVANERALATFTLALAAYYIVLTVARTLTTSPAIIMYGGDRLRFERSARAIRTINLSAMVVCALALVSICLARHNVTLTPALLLAFLPQLILDVERYLLVGSGRVRSAAIGGLGYLGSLVFVGGATLLLTSPDLSLLLVVWGGSASVGAVFLFWTGIRGGAESLGLGTYLRSARGGMSALTIESIVLAASTQAVVFILEAYGGDRSVVGYRLAVSVVLGPWTTLLMGIMPQCQILIRRWALQHPKGALSRVSALGSGVIGGTLVVGFIASQLPGTLWDLALGNSSASAHASLWWATCVVAATSGGGVWWMFARYPIGIAKTSIARSLVTSLLLGSFWLLVATFRVDIAFYCYSIGILGTTLALVSRYAKNASATPEVLPLKGG